MRRLFISFCASLLVIITPIASAQYQQVFVLGDSLSDQGNLLSTGATPALANPPYFSGRVSNGPVAVEYIAEYLSLELQPSLHLVGQANGTNFAVAGATASGTDAIDLPTQLNALLASQQGTLPEDALYIIFIGSNDVIATANLNRNAARSLLKQATRTIKDSINTMIDAGARRFLVIGVPDIGLTPRASGNRYKLGAYSWLFNRYLRQQLNRVRNSQDSDIRIAQKNLLGFLRTLVNKEDQIGFDDVSSACFVTSGETPGLHPDCNFDTFLFFDDLHPTTAIHQRAASFLNSYIPLP